MYRCSTMVALIAVSLSATHAGAADVEFNRDIRPILSDHCFTCHGPDNNLRKAKLRLDVETGTKPLRGGASVVAPGKPADSELYRRLVTADPDEKMPPPK